jgi:hypothetical protein
LPHSEIRGSTGARPSPRLIAACHVLHRLSVPRHPPDALLSSSPTLSPKRALRARRGQMSEVRCQTAFVLDPRIEPSCRGILHPSPDRCFGCQDISLRSAGTTCPGVSSHTHAQVQPDGAAGPASRSRLASRFPENRGQRSENRPDGPSRRSSPQTRGPDDREPARGWRSRHLSSDLCSLSSEPGGPGPTRTADLTLIRRAL